MCEYGQNAQVSAHTTRIRAPVHHAHMHVLKTPANVRFVVGWFCVWCVRFGFGLCPLGCPLGSGVACHCDSRDGRGVPPLCGAGGPAEGCGLRPGRRYRTVLSGLLCPLTCDDSAV
jgi:hypothetical protein